MDGRTDMYMYMLENDTAIQETKRPGQIGRFGSKASSKVGGLDQGWYNCAITPRHSLCTGASHKHSYFTNSWRTRQALLFHEFMVHQASTPN